MRKKVSLILVFAMTFLLVINPDRMIGGSNEASNVGYTTLANVEKNIFEAIIE